jgi:hypothetical protein
MSDEDFGKYHSNLTTHWLLRLSFVCKESSLQIKVSGKWKNRGGTTKYAKRAASSRPQKVRRLRCGGRRLSHRLEINSHG